LTWREFESLKHLLLVLVELGLESGNFKINHILASADKGEPDFLTLI